VACTRNLDFHITLFVMHESHKSLRFYGSIQRLNPEYCRHPVWNAYKTYPDGFHIWIQLGWCALCGGAGKKPMPQWPKSNQYVDGFLPHIVMIPIFTEGSLLLYKSCVKTALPHKGGSTQSHKRSTRLVIDNLGTVVPIIGSRILKISLVEFSGHTALLARRKRISLWFLVSP